METTPIQNKPPLWSFPFINIIVLNLSVFLIMFMQVGTFPGFIIQLGGTTVHAGLSIGLYTGTSSAVRPLAGYLIDRFNRKLILVLGTLILIGSLVPFLFVTTITQLLILRIIGGFAFSFISTATTTIAADILPETRMGEGLGLFSLTGVLSTAAGPAIGLAITDLFGYHPLFLSIAAVGLISLFTSLITNSPKSKKRKPKAVGRNSEITLKTKVGFSHFFPSLVLLFMAITMGVILTFIPLLGINRSIPGISLFFTTYSIAIIASRIPASQMFDTASPILLFSISVLLLFFAFIGIAFSYTILLIIFSGVLFGTGWGISQPLLNVIQLKIVPPERRGTASGIFFLCMDLGVTIGSVGFGIILDLTTFSVIFLICSVLILVSYFLFYRLVYRSSLTARPS